MDGLSYVFRARAHFYVLYDESSIQRSVVEAAHKCLSDFMSKLLRGAREGVHLQPLLLLDCPPWLVERGHSRVYP